MNQKHATNPFHEVYVTETIQTHGFVDVFSEIPVEPALALFQPGNVVLKGAQGSGKSMLLNLLKPEIRVEYLRRGSPFPVPPQFARFIGAGINIARSGSIDFGQRAAGLGLIDGVSQVPLFFADFLNYWVARDVLQSLRIYCEAEEGVIARELGINTSADALNMFAVRLAKEECWSGYLNDVQGLDQLLERMTARLRIYREYLSFNIDGMPREVSSTKSAIGEPIAKTAAALWECAIVPADVHVFVRIDQYEDLGGIHGGSELSPLLEYRAVVNKALALRDRRVSYRIGTRPYAFNVDNLRVYGTSSHLENERNYKIVDLDDHFRKTENKPWVFPAFAEDVFRRRMQTVGIKAPGNALEHVFGDGLVPEAEAKRYVARDHQKAIRVEDEWPDEIKSSLRTLAESDPLSARLGEAWVRQKRERKEAFSIQGSPYPWAAKSRQYWRKERVRQALMQIAARNQQRMLWSGKGDILALSGGNVLVFVSLCQHIWDAWLRSTSSQIHKRTSELPEINHSVQSEGIWLASCDWHAKIPELPRGASRQRFIDTIGKGFRATLLDDVRMSYPGHNGFSIDVHELAEWPEANEFLRDAVDYGALFDGAHTTKEKNRNQRWKWYINPVLTPMYQIPHTRGKEPLYATRELLASWLSDSRAIPATEASLGTPKPMKESKDLPLLDLMEGAEADDEE